MRLSALFRRCLLAVALAASLPASALSPSTTPTPACAPVLTVMKQHEIAGMAVAVTRQGEQHFYSFGLASWETRVPVTNDTLFEVGSISKTYSATLAAYAQALGRLSLADPVERHVPELAGSAFGRSRCWAWPRTRRAAFRCRCLTRCATAPSSWPICRPGNPATRRARAARMPIPASACWAWPPPMPWARPMCR